MLLRVLASIPFSGGGSGQSNNKIRIGWDGVGALRVQVDAGDFGSNWPISVTGNAGFLGGQAPSYYTDILARLGYTPVQQGGGAGQGSSKVYIGWGGTKLYLQIDASNFAGTWPIDISGNAASLGGVSPNGYAGVSQSTSSNDIAFPIGHTILVNTSGTPFARNAVIAPYTYGGDSNQYVLAAAAAGGSALAGTWRARGTVGSITSAERVA